MTMMNRDNCPRCQGTLGMITDMYGVDIFCRMCGWHFNPKFDLSEAELKSPRTKGPYRTTPNIEKKEGTVET